MNLLKKIRQQLTKHLWEKYRCSLPEIQRMEQVFSLKSWRAENNSEKELLDHFAIIDLPSTYTGLDTLCQIFLSIGYQVQGRDYLPEKQNEFLWMVEEDALENKLPSNEVLPQVVVADFRIDALPLEIKKTLEKYTNKINPSPLAEIQYLSDKTSLGDESAAHQLLQHLITYFSGKNWPTPNVADFTQIHEFNELLAWTLLFGRQPNHFAIAAHKLGLFEDLHALNQTLTEKLNISFNQQRGIIKGESSMGILQSATQGKTMTVSLTDGNITIPDKFIEFVWRYPKANIKNPLHWKDYYTGFVGKNANYVIESLISL